MYMNDGISAVERFEGLGSGNPPKTASDDPGDGGEDPTEGQGDSAKKQGTNTANEASTKTR